MLGGKGGVRIMQDNARTLGFVLVDGLDEQGAGQAEEARVEGGLGRVEHKGLGEAVFAGLAGAARARHLW